MTVGGKSAAVTLIRSGTQMRWDQSLRRNSSSYDIPSAINWMGVTLLPTIQENLKDRIFFPKRKGTLSANQHSIDFKSEFINLTPPL